MTSTTKFTMALAVLFFSQGLIDSAKAQQYTFADAVKKLVNPYNIDEMKIKLETKTNELEERAKNVLEALKHQYNTNTTEGSEKASAAYEDAVQSLNLYLTFLRLRDPQAMDEVYDFQQRCRDSFMNKTEAFFEESAKLAKAAGGDKEKLHESFTELSRSSLVYTIAVIQSLQYEFQVAVKKANRSSHSSLMGRLRTRSLDPRSSLPPDS